MSRKIRSGPNIRPGIVNSMGKPIAGDNMMITGNEGVGLKRSGQIDSGANVAARLNKPKGMDGK